MLEAAPKADPWRTLGLLFVPGAQTHRLNPGDRDSRDRPEKLAADLLASMPYAAALGITVDETAPGLVRGRLRCTASGLLARALHAGRSFTGV